jgi:FKBP-type peptidyl-prolyl cis-trans isomerase FkpA
VELVLGSAIKCWVEGVQKMKVGERARLVCPPALAYGEEGRPPTMPGNATLIFEIDLVGIAGP